MEHSDRSHASPERRRLRKIKDLLEQIAELDNHISSIYAAINGIFSTMHIQKRTLVKKLAVMRRNPTNKARRVGLEEAYEAGWEGLRTDLKAQRDALALEEDLRNSLIKELNTLANPFSPPPP
ncbi:hypothetical protein TWF481_002739 [Arthrobotrys musiformis]|uniref:Uncharacterized protein n=1 Tax=Arthrobotrys musiformis TaxID=47236 RepID=A0AAV9VR39_9PEZI